MSPTLICPLCRSNAMVWVPSRQTLERWWRTALDLGESLTLEPLSEPVVATITAASLICARKCSEHFSNRKIIELAKGRRGKALRYLREFQITTLLKLATIRTDLLEETKGCGPETVRTIMTGVELLASIGPPPKALTPMKALCGVLLTSMSKQDEKQTESTLEVMKDFIEEWLGHKRC